MASRSWGRSGPAYGGGYIGANASSNLGFYVNPMDRRPVYSSTQMVKPYAGGGYRDDPYRNPREDFRAKGRSPIGDKRQHGESFRTSQDVRSGKRSQQCGKYEVKVPKMPFNLKSATVSEIKLAHPHVPIPNDFSRVNLQWQDEFPLYKPMNIGFKADVHILHKDVEPIMIESDQSLNPSDVDFSYSVRVMLMASPDITELYKNSFRIADEPLGSEKTPIAKSIHFLVGGKGKLETMGIGGPWSRSLDGNDPGQNPQTLIKTAIRTFRCLTGIDLSSVTEWTRFMEVRYSRCANTKVANLDGDDECREVTEDKQEVVVFLIPNVSNLAPSEEEWEKTKKQYADALEKRLNPCPSETKLEDTDTLKVIDSTLDDSQEITDIVSGEPTHYSKLDVNTMKVNELRAELVSRNLDIKGVKSSLISRLQNSLDEEKKADKGDQAVNEAVKTTEETPTDSAAVSSQPMEENKEITEKDRRRLERLYRLGDKPSILVYPNRSARGGRFDCHRVSLHSLLNCRSEEQNENNFEVSLFVEQFHAMLQRDCAFNIFKAIYTAPEKDTKEIKVEVNGVSTEDSKEPPNKRRRDISAVNQENIGTDDGKTGRSRRTIDPKLLFSFTYFDVGYAEFIRDYDLVDILHLLDLGYSKAQMKKLVSKVTDKRDHIQYRNLTDKDIEGDVENSTSKPESDDPEFIQDLAAGNDILFGGEKSEIPALVFITGSDKRLLDRMLKIESVKKITELQLFLLKNELEKTQARLNTNDTEEKLRKENRQIKDKLKEEEKSSQDNKILVNTYNDILRKSRELMSTAVSEIQKQFEKEREKREAERLAAEEEKAKLEAMKTKEEADKNPEKNDEKEWEVVDQV